MGGAAICALCTHRAWALSFWEHLLRPASIFTSEIRTRCSGFEGDDAVNLRDLCALAGALLLLG